jgi:predicted transcriptional regulator
MSVQFSIQMDEALKKKLDSEAVNEDRSASYLVSKAVEQFLYTRAHKREVIMAAYSASQTEKEFISGEAMNAWVNSWGTESELIEPKPDIFR